MFILDRPVPAYIGLGSNLADPVVQVRAGMQALAGLPATTVDRCSSLYLSKPIGPADQPDFINAACRLTTRLSAKELLGQLLALETRQGRRRIPGQEGGPRVLDLDLLLYADQEIHAPGLTVPHPRLHERAFVLYPLHEIDPELPIPGRGTVQALVRGCSNQAIERWNEIQ